MANYSGIPNKDLTWDPIPVESLDLKGKRVVLVGGTGGIGRALARCMAHRNAQVTVVGRTFRDADMPGVSFIMADLELMSEAKRVGRELAGDEFDLLILTTGIMAGPKREVTAEGIERDLAVSYLSRLAIVGEIAPHLGTENTNMPVKPRIFIMGMPGTNQIASVNDLNSEKKYLPMQTHSKTVAGNEALVLYGAHRYPNVNFYGLNPGLIKTSIRSNMSGGQDSVRFKIMEGMIGLLTISADTYARRIVPLLFSKDIESASGAFFNQKALAILPSEIMTESYVDEIIKASEELLNRALHNDSSVT